MSATAFLIGLILASQVSSSNERYPLSGGQANAAAPAGGNAAGSGLIAPLGSSPADGRTPPRGSAAGTVGGADPYRNQPGLPGAGGERFAPPGGVTPPPAAAAPRSPYNGATPPAASAPPNQQAAGVKPSAMIRDMLSPPRGSQISGDYIRLVDVVSGATSRLEQTQRVEAYWDLCSSVADYYLGLREQDELRRLRALVPRVGPTWEEAESELTVRMGTSQRAAVAAQLRVASFLGRDTGKLPLPADIPHCGSYRSRYEEIFAGRPTAEAQELALLLPLRYTELKDAAAAATRAEEWVNTVARNDADGTGTLRALEFSALRRRAFVQIARDYNRRIARYTELATPGEVGADRLVGMLIKQENPSTATRSTTPAAPTGRQSNNSAGAPPQTFVEGAGWEPVGRGGSASVKRDDAVRPTSAETRRPLRRERSLLVRPR